MQPTHIINENCSQKESFFIFDLCRLLQHSYNLEFDSDDLRLTAIAAYIYEIALGKKDEEIDLNIRRLVHKYIRDTKSLLPILERHSVKDMAFAILQSDKYMFKDTNFFHKNSILALIDKFLEIKDKESVCVLNPLNSSLLQDLSLKYINTKFYTSNMNNLLNAISRIKTQILKSNVSFDGKNFLDFYHIHSQDKFDKVFYHSQDIHFSMYERSDTSVLEFTKLINTLGIDRNISITVKNLHLAMHMLKDTGHVVALIPTTYLLRSDDKTSNFKTLVDNKYVEAIISLANEFYDGGNKVKNLHKSSMSLVILSHNNDKVRLIDLSSKAKEDIDSIYDALYKDDLKYTYVDLDTIKENNYIVHPLYYTLDNKDFAHPVSLNSLVKKSSIKEQKDAREALKEKRLTLRLLRTFCNNDKIESEHILSPLELHFRSYNQYKDRVSFKGYCVSLDKNLVNPFYLKAFFKSDIGYNSILKAMFKNPNFILDNNNLLNIEVLLPPMALQNKIGEQYKDAISKIDSLHKELDKTIKSIPTLCKNLI